MYSSKAQPESSSDWECLWLMSALTCPCWVSSFTSPDMVRESDSVFLKISTISDEGRVDVVPCEEKSFMAHMFPLKIET